LLNEHRSTWRQPFLLCGLPFQISPGRSAEGAASTRLDARIVFQLSALFHHRGQQVVAEGISLVLKIGENLAAQRALLVSRNQTIDSGFRYLQQAFARGFTGSQSGHQLFSLVTNREATLPLYLYRPQISPPLAPRTPAPLFFSA
jgi:hypothetical protein